MKFKKVICIFTFCGFLLARSISYADQESHEKAAEALLDSMNMNELLQQSVEAMLQLELEKTPSLMPYADTMREFFSLYMGEESLRPEFVRLYIEVDPNF